MLIINYNNFYYPLWVNDFRIFTPIQISLFMFQTCVHPVEILPGHPILDAQNQKLTGSSNYPTSVFLFQWTALQSTQLLKAEAHSLPFSNSYFQRFTKTCRTKKYVCISISTTLLQATKTLAMDDYKNLPGLPSNHAQYSQKRLSRIQIWNMIWLWVVGTQIMYHRNAHSKPIMILLTSVTPRNLI